MPRTTFFDQILNRKLLNFCLFGTRKKNYSCFVFFNDSKMPEQEFIIYASKRKVIFSVIIYLWVLIMSAYIKMLVLSYFNICVFNDSVSGYFYEPLLDFNIDKWAIFKLFPCF